MQSVFEEDVKHIWEKALRCLPELANGRMLITGGTGFFGKWLLESLAYAVAKHKLNIHVVVLSRDPQRFLNEFPAYREEKWLHWLQGDVRNFSFPDESFTHIIHAATDASASLNREDPQLMLETITLGTRRVLELAKIAAVKRFLFISSGAVYGEQPGDCMNIPEKYIGIPAALSNTSAYAAGKLQAEQLCEYYANQYQMPVIIARCFAFVGPYLPLTTHFAIGNFIANALSNEPIHIKGDGSPCRSYLYAADLVIWLWTLLCFGESGGVYNVGSENSISIADLARLVQEQACLRMPVIISGRKRNDVVERYIPCTRRAREALQLRVWVDLPDAIKRTLIWNQHYAKSK